MPYEHALKDMVSETQDVVHDEQHWEDHKSEQIAALIEG